MGSFEKYSTCTQWVLGEQIASELTMNPPCSHWVSVPLPPVIGIVGFLVVVQGHSQASPSLFPHQDHIATG